MSVNNLNFEEALSLLEEITTDSSFEIDLISVPKPVLLKDLNAHHVKLLYNCSENEELFEKVFLEILKDVIQDKTLICEELTNLDVICLALKLRQRMSDKITYVFSEEDSDVQKEISVNLEETYNTVFSKIKDVYNLINNYQIKYKDLTIELKIPSLKSYVTEVDFKDREIEPFLLECTRFINYLYFKDKNYKFEEKNPEENLKIIELLPASILQNITSKILEFKNSLASILTLDIIQDNKNYQIFLEIKESLFFAD